MKKIKKRKNYNSIYVVRNNVITNHWVKAALQANPNTHTKKTDTPTNWMSNFRKMETTGGTMGLSESLNSDLTSKRN